MTTLAPARHSFDSLFSGIAGLDNGLHRRMPCNLVVEEAAHPRAILRKHFPHVRQMNDVREVKGSDLRGTILVAGFPCKDTSIAGPRVGLAGARSGLFFEIIRLMHEHRPEWVIVENPDGALTSNKGRDWLTVTRDFTREGYSWAYRVVDARTLDTPGLRSNQKRTRIILVAHRDGDIGPCLDVLGIAADDYTAVQPDAPKVVWGTAGTGGPDNVTVTGAAPAPVVEALPSWDSIITNAPAPEASCWLTPEQAEKLLPRLRSHAGLDPDLLAAVQSVADEALVLVDDGDVTVWRKSARAQKSIEAGGWESWVRSAHSNTLTCFDIGGPLRQTHLIYQCGRVRTLTLTEWERLCGFEDGWTEGIPDGARFTALGNCVHVGTGEWLAEQLVSVMVRMEAEQDWRLFA